MKIDRHNYEEFFILYWDNELTTAQKQMVEDFITVNTDLQEEFRIFGETRFTPDGNIQLETKEFLQNDSFINITNYEEQLLNYIDDELSADEDKVVEKFASQYPAVQKDLSLLQKTKLQPEAEVVFPDKSVLYRPEEKVRVISIYWRRMAVAAAVLLIGGFAALRLINNNNGDGTTTPAMGSVASVEETKKDPPEKQTVTNSLQADQNNDLANIDNRKTAAAKETEEKQGNNKRLVIKNNPANSVSNEIAVYVPENKNNLPKERLGKVNVNDLNSVPSETASVNIPTIEKKTGKADAVTASFNEPDVTLQRRYTLHIQTPSPVVEEKEGGGLKEFLRKTTRVFERRTKIQTTTEDNKLLLGAFAVSLK